MNVPVGRSTVLAASDVNCCESTDRALAIVDNVNGLCHWLSSQSCGACTMYLSRFMLIAVSILVVILVCVMTREQQRSFVQFRRIKYNRHQEL